MVIEAEEAEWSPFNMRQYNLSILKPPVINKSGSTTKAPMSYADAAKSLDLLRQNLQRSINQEVKAVITKYMDTYIKPGVENIKNNLGNESVTEDHINNLCRTILEESKRMYPVSAYSSTSPSLLCNINSNSSAIVDHNETSPENNLNNSSQHHQLQLNHTTTSLLNSSATINLNDPVKISNSSPTTGIKRESDNDSMDTDNSRETGSVPPPNTNKKAKKSNKNAGKNTVTNNIGGGTSETSSNSSPQKSSKPIKKPTGPSRKAVTQWDATKLTPETYFIMGAKANKALGFAQTRGRLYIKHPGLFKYASDTDDKEWLSKNKLMPATGGRAYIMLLDDIMKLAKDNKLNATINYDDIKGFLVPDFILYKMKSYINSWKKTYAEEAQIQRTSAPPKTKSQTPPQIQIQQQQQQNNHQNNNNSMNLNNHHQQLKQVPVSMGLSLGGVGNQLPPPSLHAQQQQQVQQQQIHQQNSHNQQQQGLNNYHIPVQGNPPQSSNVVAMYDPNLMQSHELTDMREYMHMDKPPPMYPGTHSTVTQLSTSHQQQQHNTLPHMPQMNPSAGVYNNQQLSLQTTSQSQLSNDPFEQAMTKGDWSGVSDRSLLLYALQSTRNISAWDPQDSFDLIESVTNGGGNLGDSSSPLLQMPPDISGITAPLGDSQSPGNELSAVLDQAFQYTET